MTPSELFGEVAQIAPSFHLLVREHLRDNDGLLAHPLMHDLLQYVGSYFTGRPHMEVAPPTLGEVHAILALLDRELNAHSDPTENAIALSFVEHLEAEPFFAQLLPLLGPSLRGEYERQEILRGPA